MKLTLELIRDHMLIPGTIFGEQVLYASYYQVLLYFPQILLTQDNIYLAYAKDLNKSLNAKGLTLISIGTPNSEIINNNRVLVLEDNSTLEEVYSRVQQLIHSFQIWWDELVALLKKNRVQNQKAVLDEFFCKVSEKLGNSVFFHDDNFFLLGNSETGGTLGLTTWNYSDVKGGYILPLDILHEFRHNKEYQNTLSTHGVCMFSEATFGYRIMYINIWNDMRYRGRICVNELNRTFMDSDFYILEKIAYLITESLRNNSANSYSQTYSISRFFIALIRDEVKDEFTTNNLLGQYGWKEGDQYFCCCFYSTSEKLSEQSRRYYSSLFFNEYPHSCSFPFEDSIVLIINQSLNPISISDFRQSIGLILREGLLKIGISMSNNSFQEFKYIFNQAKEAFLLGEKYDDNIWIHDFSEMKQAYIRNAISEKMPVHLLCHPDLFKLKKYDSTHTSDLYHTFYVYLENDRSLSRTAEILNIHRTTLLFRMRKINELISSDYLDSEERFALWFSYKLLQ